MLLINKLFLLSLKWCQARHKKRGLVIPNVRRITRHGTISGTVRMAEHFGPPTALSFAYVE